jgi:hypothetical protein
MSAAYLNRLMFVPALLLIVAWPVTAQPDLQRVSADAPANSLDATAAVTFKPDRSVEALAHNYCPTGLEHYLPGSYYYCVAVRDMAKGNYARSREMLEIASAWGNKSAQFLLGLGYFKGDTEPLDRGKGLAWMGMAIERHDANYVAIFNSAWGQASMQERARAQVLWRSMLPKYGDQYAARRAEQRYQRERARLLSEEASGARICVVGLTSGQQSSIPVSMYSIEESNDMQCGGQTPVIFVAQRLDVYAEQLLGDWRGHVSVGPLKPVQGPIR